MNTPLLRFSGFNKSFEKKIFDEILDITRLAGYEYSEYWQEDENKEIIALRGYNIGKGILELQNLGFISNELSLKLKRSRLFKGDIVYPCVGTIGNAVVIEENDKYHIQQNIAKLTPNDDVSPYFIAQFLMSNWGLKEVYRFNATSSQPNVLVGSLRNFRINLPTLPEQQKIASFLTEVDNKLQALKRKKDLLEQYKKGIMQKLFSQELRLKDENGKPYPNWEKKKLGEVGQVVNGLTYSPDNIHKDGILVLRSSNIRGRSLAFEDCVFVSVEEGKFNPLQENDILICVRNGSKNLIGKNALITRECEGLAFGAFMAVFRGKQNEFIFHLFDTDYYKKEVHKNLGATINSINGSDLKKFKFPIPSSIEEQTKIANFLTAIDQKIAQVGQQISKAETWKKGLLQKMFV